jgi:hypothetical protein
MLRKTIPFNGLCIIFCDSLSKNRNYNLYVHEQRMHVNLNILRFKGIRRQKNSTIVGDILF